MRDIQPFTDLERAIKVALAENAEENPDITPNYPEAHEDLLRWDATLRKVEIALAEMTRERDAFETIVRWYQGKTKPGQIYDALEALSDRSPLPGVSRAQGSIPLMDEVTQ